ncbi:unnamed protein product, partial [Pleuronectes platessa]
NLNSSVGALVLNIEGGLREPTNASGMRQVLIISNYSSLLRLPSQWLATSWVDHSDRRRFQRSPKCTKTVSSRTRCPVASPTLVSQAIGKDGRDSIDSSNFRILESGAIGFNPPTRIIRLCSHSPRSFDLP